MNQYAVDLNYQAQELWQRIIYFDEFAEKYIAALDTKALTNWNNKSTIVKVCIVLCSFTARKYWQIYWTSLFRQLLVNSDLRATNSSNSDL